MGNKTIAQAMPRVRTDTFILRGGLDQITPRLQLKPGVAIEAENFECAPDGGYTRIAGYERFAGGLTPSERPNYYTMQLAIYGGSTTYLHSEAFKFKGVTSQATFVFAGRLEGLSSQGPVLSNEVFYVTDVRGAFIPGEVIQTVTSLNPTLNGPRTSVT